MNSIGRYDNPACRRVQPSRYSVWTYLSFHPIKKKNWTISLSISSALLVTITANQAPETELPDLPVEILHNIFSRSDTDLLTLVRYVATSKLLHRVITDPIFIHQLRHDANRRFIPSLLLGMFFQHNSEAIRFDPVLPYSNLKLSATRPPPGGGRHDDIYLLLASRAGLVVLHRFRTLQDTYTILELCVGPAAGLGHYVSFPRPALYAYSYVLLSGDGDEDEHGNNFSGLPSEQGTSPRRSVPSFLIKNQGVEPGLRATSTLGPPTIHACSSFQRRDLRRCTLAVP